MHQDQPTISSSVLLSLFNDLSAHRQVMIKGLERFGIDFGVLNDFHGYIGLKDFVGIFEWLSEALDDPSLGLRVSQRSGPDALGAVGYLFLSSGTIEKGVQSLVRYLDAIQSSSRMEIIYVDDLVQVRYRIVDDSIAPRRQDSEYSIGLVWRYIQLLSKNRCPLVQVSFEHGRSGKNSAYARRVFNAPILYERDDNEFTLALKDFRTWHEALDPHLFPILEDHISSNLQTPNSPATFPDSVRNLLTENMISDGARAAKIAKQLRISEVTLHRRLRKHGLRFKELVDNRSKALAERLLIHTSLPVAAISQRVGFKDPAAFSRAFRRWFALPPRTFRELNRSGQ